MHSPDQKDAIQMGQYYLGLMGINEYLLRQGLITQEEAQKMECMIKLHYGSPKSSNQN